jgi:hypothetical protein
MMDKVQKPNNSEYYTPLSEPFGILPLSLLHFTHENNHFSIIHTTFALHYHRYSRVHCMIEGIISRSKL